MAKQRTVPELTGGEWERWYADTEGRLVCPVTGCGKRSAAYWNGVDETLTITGCGHNVFIPEEEISWPPPATHVRAHHPRTLIGMETTQSATGGHADFAAAMACMQRMERMEEGAMLTPQELAALHSGAAGMFSWVRWAEEDFSRARGTYSRACMAYALPGERERAWEGVVASAHALVAAKRRHDVEEHNF